MTRLTYYDFDKIEKTLDLGDDPVLIGRSTECQIRTEDAVVSRRHARIVLDGGDYWIEDLGSLRGVYVGGEEITRAQMVPGEPAGVGGPAAAAAQAAAASAATTGATASAATEELQRAKDDATRERKLRQSAVEAEKDAQKKLNTAQTELEKVKKAAVEAKKAGEEAAQWKER